MKCVSRYLVFFISFSLFAKSNSTIVKDFREIFMTLSNVTKVSLKNENIKKLYALNFLTLPKDGHLDEVNEATLLSLFKVSYTFCSEALDADLKKSPQNRHLYLNHPIEKEISKWSKEEKLNLYKDFSLQIYQREILSDEIVAIHKLEQKLSLVESSKFLNTVCSSLFSSPSFYIRNL